MTREQRIKQHRKNVEWINGQIRICIMARRLLKGQPPKNYWWLIRDASEHVRPELLPLKALVFDSEAYRESYRLRFENYNLALLSEVFDIRKWLYEARALKWKEQEAPWLTPAAAT